MASIKIQLLLKRTRKTSGSSKHLERVYSPISNIDDNLKMIFVLLQSVKSESVLCYRQFTPSKHEFSRINSIPKSATSCIENLLARVNFHRQNPDI